jgi:asparagine synthetase B (glutamine-hydrolysing)
MISDVPKQWLLSGGLDSSSITASLKKQDYAKYSFSGHWL